MVAENNIHRGAIRFYLVHDSLNTKTFHGGIHTPYGGENMGLQLQQIFGEEHLPRGDPLKTFNSVRSSFTDLYNRSRETCLRQVTLFLNTNLPPLPTILEELQSEDTLSYPFVFDLLVGQDGTVNMKTTRSLTSHDPDTPHHNDDSSGEI